MNKDVSANQWAYAKDVAGKISSYLVKASSLTLQSSPETYREANEMVLELAMLIPADLYKQMIAALTTPNEKDNLYTFVIAMRQYLLGDSAGDLGPQSVALHGPGIGNKPDAR